MNLSAGVFLVSAQGQMSVTYTVTDNNNSSATSFSIGIYGSPDRVTPANLLQTYQVTDPSMLTPGQHTALFDAALSGLTESDYLLAKLDINDQVYETSRADDTSAPWEGLFQQGDGSVYVVEDSSVSVAVRQDANSGNVTVKLNGSDQPAFSNVSGVTVSTPGTSTNTVSVDSSVTALFRLGPAPMALPAGRWTICRP